MDNWHLKLFSKSVLKKEKWHQINRLLPNLDNKACLDLGSDNGVISYLLRQQGGQWTSADLSMETVNSIESLVKTNVVHIDNPPHLPFADHAFDVIVIVDMLEHVEDDHAFALEIKRILKPEGELIVLAPHKVSWSLIRPLQYMLGLTDEKHGHVRPGYTKKELAELFDSFDVATSRAYSRFFSELIDIIICFGMGLLKGSEFRVQSSECTSQNPEPRTPNSSNVATQNSELGTQNLSERATQNTEPSKGNVVTSHDMNKYKKLFMAYSLTYPLFWLFAQFDHLIFFLSGHKLIVKMKRWEV
ncbi:MAG: class I SAM-dependent methyltransferase [Candidatus Omnitrophica bacterium]|nr:class I SAM-dependent methyltransferase [Candidatus Omnitrophota bacterium]